MQARRTNMKLQQQDDSPNIRYSYSKSFKMENKHIHNHYEMLFLVDGMLSVENNADKLTVKSPAIILHNSLTFHGVNTLRDGYTRYVVNFNDDIFKHCPAIADKISFFRSSNISVIKLDNDMFELMKIYFDRYRVIGKDLDARAYLTAMILYELYTYQSATGNIISETCRTPYINELLEYISGHFAEPLSLDSLAQQYYISRAKLVQDFKQSTGMTVKDYITMIRINNARFMLGGGMSVQETAKNCGYDSVSYFVTLFKNMFGVSPGKFDSYIKKRMKEFFEENKGENEVVYFNI